MLVLETKAKKKHASWEKGENLDSMGHLPWPLVLKNKSLYRTNCHGSAEKVNEVGGNLSGRSHLTVFEKE